MTSDCIGFFFIVACMCILYTCDCIYIGVCISQGIVCASRQKSVRSSDSSAHNHNTLAETHSQALIHTQYLAFDYYATSVPVQFHQRVPRRWAFSSRTQNVLCSSAHTQTHTHTHRHTHTCIYATDTVKNPSCCSIAHTIYTIAQGVHGNSF